MSEPRTTPQKHPSKIPSRKKRLRKVAIGVPFYISTREERKNDVIDELLQIYYRRSLAPQSLEPVELALHLAEDMNYDVTKVE